MTDTAIHNTRDATYIQMIVDPLMVCKNYKPKFGYDEELSLTAFQTQYGNDPFYAWFGLDSPLLYAAHKAAGGMTSIYRQLGIGCQRLFQQILIDQLGLSLQQSSWSYSVSEAKTRYLNGRITLADVGIQHKETLQHWIHAAGQYTQADEIWRQNAQGIVFEVRQGYKSRDSKRQNADIENAGVAYSMRYLPTLLLLSTQIDTMVARRYADARWLVLRGTSGRHSVDFNLCFLS